MSKFQLAVRILQFLYEKLNRYFERSGTSKTEVVVALAHYLDCSKDLSLSQRVAHLEAKMEELQALAKR